MHVDAQFVHVGEPFIDVDELERQRPEAAGRRLEGKTHGIASEFAAVLRALAAQQLAIALGVVVRVNSCSDGKPTRAELTDSVSDHVNTASKIDDLQQLWPHAP
ncbi:hypothetical protein PQQ64_20350 [Paraburkholderia graminis]|uniref:hypothetical protein n=1 Tax=Paraburkholderia graminis TaxID=60548 RepID=UPI0038BADB3A